MSTIETSICSAVSIEVKPVRYRIQRPENRPVYTFATQRLVVTAHDGNKIEITVHLEDGCLSIAPGAVVSLPTVDELEGAEQ